jgi:hypothetical protein
VLGVGWLVRQSVHTSKDFFEAGRRTPAWVAGLAFVSANRRLNSAWGGIMVLFGLTLGYYGVRAERRNRAIGRTPAR